MLKRCWLKENWYLQRLEWLWTTVSDHSIYCLMMFLLSNWLLGLNSRKLLSKSRLRNSKLNELNSWLTKQFKIKSLPSSKLRESQWLLRPLEKPCLRTLLTLIWEELKQPKISQECLVQVEQRYTSTLTHFCWTWPKVSIKIWRKSLLHGWLTKIKHDEIHFIIGQT